MDAPDNDAPREAWQAWSRDATDDSVKRMRAAGVRFVMVLDSGNGDECEYCAALAGKRYEIEHAPALPPPGCSCEPHCLCMLIAVE